MISKIIATFLTVIFALAALPVAQAQEAKSTANSTVNKDDPNLQKDDDRLNRAPEALNADVLTPGIPCETGACFKPAYGKVGYEDNLITPGEGAPATSTKTDESAK